MDRKELLSKPVQDLRIDGNTTLSNLMAQFSNIGGFTAAKLYEAHSIISDMFLEDNTTFLSFPADIISTGLRGLINDVVKRKLVDVIITTSGTLDHDIARTFGKYYCGSFNYSDVELREININRLGNVLVPDESYGELIEEKVMEQLEKLYSIKKEWATVDLIKEIGLSINNESSILYNAAKNDIPIFVPGITDGSFGSQLWSFYEQHHDFKINLLEDEHRLSDIIFDAKKTGAIMVGGGISKHHTIWWNQFRDGLDYAVYITTAQEYDGSLSGAKLEEAISWKKVRPNARFVNIYGDATVIMPILMAPFL
ncbi:deoxyhypusine synthase [Thermoplasma volcanium GSS1]|uniref:Probable deoxyhypusine synthase n=1 Tax=Thermoplasma volcanium (strain ATCC 51530 / DSM 4299 / JCM 9571 / NBRC 15438 / GSS1) TaxID=273116 RepID=DHYS_THEVO|nr:deoxyhypusine synthase [Thermoplasma volcanium]Q97BN6.1 RecName: Full=Probable deoxyhypusine synthase; Short=DHS [Thermoplasma volcanium GSS1]BAB59561.1 deoxyhypusine synthase [Thermoplasma volcanium GSS1]